MFLLFRGTKIIIAIRIDFLSESSPRVREIPVSRNSVTVYSTLIWFILDGDTCNRNTMFRLIYI